MVEVEAVLNSRPILADSINPHDVEAITPAHLLVGRTLATLPPADGGSCPQSRRGSGRVGRETISWDCSRNTD
ncbi:hypothetical protein ACLKA6_008706 [Drosophila palustris]